MNPSGSIKNNYFLIVFDISLTRYVYSHNHLKTIFGVTIVLPNYELSKTMADGRLRADFWTAFRSRWLELNTMTTFLIIAHAWRPDGNEFVEKAAQFKWSQFGTLTTFEKCVLKYMYIYYFRSLRVHWVRALRLFTAWMVTTVCHFIAHLSPLIISISLGVKTSSVVSAFDR